MKFTLMISLLILLSGCSLQRDFDYASHLDVVQVNGFLHPDSAIFVRVSRTAPYPAGNTFAPIKDATVLLYENNTRLPQLAYNPEKQAYTLDRYPREGFSYRLVVKVAGQDSVFAQTRIPTNAVSEACYKRFTNPSWRYNNKAYLDIHISKTDRSAVNWIGLTSKVFDHPRTSGIPPWRPDSSSVKNVFIGPIYSNSSIIDRFNSTLDEGLYYYSFYMRLNPSEQIAEYHLDAFSFDTSYFFPYDRLETLHDSLGLYVHVFTASEEYDRYWKASVLYFINNNYETDIPNPFTEQIVTYSNITNGTGIFAGYNSQTIGVHQSKCR